MSTARTNLRPVDPVWDQIRSEAELTVQRAPRMGAMMHAGILQHARFEDALAYRLAMKLASSEMSAQEL